MFGGLSDKLIKIFDKLSGRGMITEAVLDETMREVKIALLEADVALPVVKEFIASVKEKAAGQEVVKSIKPAQMVIKIVHDTLQDLLGTPKPFQWRSHQVNPVLMLGLQGAGKTTTTAKLALTWKKEGKKVLMVSLDTYRPAAQEQLQVLAEQHEIDCVPVVPGEKPLQIAKRALEQAKVGLYDVLLLDTAGRLHIDEEMMGELKNIHALAEPTESLLVLDALMGQDTVNVVEKFQEQIPITGAILTRIDGDARGGAALSLRMRTGVPIQFLGVGEKASALEVFDAKRLADRILGMGDVVGLVETALEKIDQKKSEEAMARMMAGKFNLNDLLGQIRQINSLGDMKGIMMMIPGMARFREKIEQANMDNSILKRQEAIILSMTPKERCFPDIIKASRKIRIAAGAGVTVNDVNRLLKQYDQMAEVMKKFKKMGPLGMMSLMKKMSGGAGQNFFGNGGGTFPPVN